MYIKLINFEGVKSFEVDFGTSGIVEMKGPNSNGKSIIPDAIEFVAKGFINDPERRKDAINDNASEAEIIFIRDPKTDKRAIRMLISKEKADCFLQYYSDFNMEPDVSRSLREGGWDELVKDFGFRTFGKQKFCLQVSETYGVYPFLNSSWEDNWALIKAMTTDEVSEQFLNNFKKITHPELRRKNDRAKEQFETIKQTLDSLPVYELDELQDLYLRLKEAELRLVYLRPLYYAEVTPPPVIEDYLNIKDLIVSEVPIFDVYQPLAVKKDIEDIELSLIELEKIENKVCPMCGHKLLEEEHNHV